MTRRAMTRRGTTRAPAPAAVEPSFLAGGGEMGACLRAHDWSATPLGAPARWPAALRHAVRRVLASTEPSALVWKSGADSVHFGNDALARLLGGDVGVLGRDPALASVIDAVRRRGEPAVAEDQLVCVARSGRAKEAYVTCRLEPVPDGARESRGVMMTLAETTDRVVSARRTAVLRGLASVASSVGSEAEAHSGALAEIARHPADLPFALLYVREDGGDARLAGVAGLTSGAPASPARVALTASSDAGWPVGAALAQDDIVTVADLASRFGALPGGEWPIAPRAALAVPVTSPGSDRPDGVLVLGVSARRSLDAEYRGFLELVARQVAAAIAAGRTREERRRRAAASAAATKRARARQRAQARAIEARFAGMLEERTRVAREIHDTLLQGVTGIALQLRAALPHVRRDPESAGEVLERMVALAESTSRDARRAVWDLRAPAADEGGLPGALLAAAGATARGTVDGGGPSVGLDLHGTPRRLPRVVHDALFHVGQEAAVNAVRHAAARSVTLRLRYTRNAVRLTVVDDGCGFAVDPEFRAYAGHWGLLGMRERAERAGATLTVSSAPGAGSTVDVVVPLPARRGRA